MYSKNIHSTNTMLRARLHIHVLLKAFEDNVALRHFLNVLSEQHAFLNISFVFKTTLFDGRLTFICSPKGGCIVSALSVRPHMVWGITQTFTIGIK